MPATPSPLGLWLSWRSPHKGEEERLGQQMCEPLSRTGSEPERSSRPGRRDRARARPSRRSLLEPSVRRPGPLTPAPLRVRDLLRKKIRCCFAAAPCAFCPAAGALTPAPLPFGRGVRAALLAGRDRDGVSSIRRAAALRPQARGAAAAAGSHHTIITPFRQKARRTAPLWRPMSIRGSAPLRTPLAPAAGSAGDRGTGCRAPGRCLRRTPRPFPD